MATGIWVRLMHKNHILRDAAVDCAHNEWQTALDTACRQLDMPRPLILARHERDWEQFNQARFLPEHFMESVPFDRMEVEFIDPDKKKKNPNPYASLL